MPASDAAPAMSAGRDAAGALPQYRNAQAWRGAQLAGRDDWIHMLTPAEIAELDAAVVRAEAAGRPIPELREKDFAFVQLAARLRDIRREVLHGRGFFLLRGVPVGRYTRLQAALAYWGIGTHLGEALSQNRKGHVLGHVQNLGLDYADPEVRGYQTLAHLPFTPTPETWWPCSACGRVARADCRRSSARPPSGTRWSIGGLSSHARCSSRSTSRAGERFRPAAGRISRSRCSRHGGAA
jgi:hypothetical protein